MSGPDERRGTDGGEHPLDVEARFADIIAHFHDGEPAAPTVVDGDDRTSPDGEAAVAADHDADHDDPDVDPGDGPTLFDTGTRDPGRHEAAPTPGPAARDRFVEDLFAEAEAERAARLARIEAEVDRAVDGAGGHHFVPPEPPPFPRPDLPGRLAWAGVLIGPVLLLLCALLWTTVPSWVVGAIVTAIVAGFGYLVWRLPRSGDRDDRGDGAIV